MNLLWGGMLLIGILYGAINGRMQEITDAVLSASREASDTLYDNDGNPCLLAGTDGSCEGCRAYRTALPEDPASGLFPFSRDSGGPSGL